MKKFLFASVLFFSSYVLACDGEAQIIAKISSIGTKTYQSCIVHIEPSGVRFFSASGICPIDLSEVIVAGVEVGIKDGHDCMLDVNDELNGIIVRNQNGQIFLERN